MVFFMVGIPTFFTTRKYGRSNKLAAVLMLYPIAVLVPLFTILTGDKFSIEEILGSTLAYVLVGSLVGYYVFRGKKKTVDQS